MRISEQRVRTLLKQDADRIRVSPVMAGSIARSPNSTRIRALAITTAAVLIVLVGIAASVLVGEGTVGPAGRSDELPTPPGVDIVPPSNKLEPKLAAFSGIWEGVWDARLRGRLIVERIDRKSAQVIYVWGASVDGSLNPGWQRMIAGVSRDGRIEWGRNAVAPGGTSGACDAHRTACSAVRFDFAMSADRKTIHGYRHVTMAPGAIVNRVTMHRVGEQPRGLGLVVFGLIGALVAAVVGIGLRLRFRR
jgi:hypothetical protein